MLAVIIKRSFLSLPIHPRSARHPPASVISSCVSQSRATPSLVDLTDATSTVKITSLGSCTAAGVSGFTQSASRLEASVSSQGLPKRKKKVAQVATDSMIADYSPIFSYFEAESNRIYLLLSTIPQHKPSPAGRG